MLATHFRSGRPIQSIDEISPVEIQATFESLSKLMADFVITIGLQHLPYLRLIAEEPGTVLPKR